MKKASHMKNDDEMRSEYDFTGGERGRLARKYGRGVTLLVLEPEVARAFGDADTAGQVLKALAGVLSKAKRRAAARRRPRR